MLVVDDDPGVREVACKVLRRAGYRVLSASDGPSAIDLSRSFDGPIHLLLTDVVMPGMGGRKVGETITGEREETRVLYMSAYTEDEVILRGVRVAEVSFLSKPFTLKELNEAVQEALET